MFFKHKGSYFITGWEFLRGWKGELLACPKLKQRKALAPVLFNIVETQHLVFRTVACKQRFETQNVASLRISIAKNRSAEASALAEDDVPSVFLNVGSKITFSFWRNIHHKPTPLLILLSQKVKAKLHASKPESSQLRFSPCWFRVAP